MNFFQRFRNRPETASRRRRAAFLGFLSGAALCGIWALWDRHLQMSYELIVVSDGTPQSEKVWFWLDGEAFFTHRKFAVAGSSDRIVRLTYPLRRATRDPALLEIANWPDGRRDPSVPVPPDAERILVEGGGYRLHCTILAEITSGQVAFRTGPRRASIGPCERTLSPAGYD
ncbi:MAG: hypothetical protein JNL71_19430 [Rhodospirillales bacterium]|nr:hypothetical protein [Rhodospirillales bacterium]